MDQDQGAESKAGSAGGLWFCSLGAFGLFALTSGKAVLALGFLLLGVFAFFNNPLVFNEPIPSKPGARLRVSWACGLAGGLAVLWAAFASWS